MRLEKKEDGSAGPVVTRKCSKCSHNQMSYAAVQLRSVRSALFFEIDMFYDHLIVNLDPRKLNITQGNQKKCYRYASFVGSDQMKLLREK